MASEIKAFHCIRQAILYLAACESLQRVQVFKGTCRVSECTTEFHKPNETTTWPRFGAVHRLNGKPDYEAGPLSLSGKRGIKNTCLTVTKEGS